jgi:hypothetical protein
MEMQFTAEATLVKPTKTLGLKMSKKTLKGDFSISSTKAPSINDKKLKSELAKHFLQRFPAFHDVMDLTITELIKVK